MFERKKRITYAEDFEKRLKNLEDKIAIMTYDISELYKEKCQNKITEFNIVYGTHAILDYTVKKDGTICDWRIDSYYALVEDGKVIYKFEYMDFKRVYDELLREPIQNALKVYCYDKNKQTNIGGKK